MPYTLTIAPKKGAKGRTFRAFLLSYLTANSLWDCGSTDKAKRPVYLAFAATDQEARAFTANLRTGRRAVVGNAYGHDEGAIEVLKTSGHRFVFQRRGGATIVTAFLPELFELDPGLLGERVSFIWAPPTWWVERQVAASALAPFPEAERRELVLAGSFAAFLDRRTPLPILSDPAFHRRLYHAAQEQLWFVRPSGYRLNPGRLFAYPDELAGLELAALVDVDHATFEDFLRRETTTYFENEVPHGTHRIASRCRLLPDPVAPARQLSLFDLLQEAA